jgi:hypothetical protein
MKKSFDTNRVSRRKFLSNQNPSLKPVMSFLMHASGMSCRTCTATWFSELQTWKKRRVSYERTRKDSWWWLIVVLVLVVVKQATSKSHDSCWGFIAMKSREMEKKEEESYLSRTRVFSCKTSRLLKSRWWKINCESRRTVTVHDHWSIDQKSTCTPTELSFFFSLVADTIIKHTTSGKNNNSTMTTTSNYDPSNQPNLLQFHMSTQPY